MNNNMTDIQLHTPTSNSDTDNDNEHRIIKYKIHNFPIFFYSLIISGLYHYRNESQFMSADINLFMKRNFEYIKQIRFNNFYSYIITYVFPIFVNVCIIFSLYTYMNFYYNNNTYGLWLLYIIFCITNSIICNNYFNLNSIDYLLNLPCIHNINSLKSKINNVFIVFSFFCYIIFISDTYNIHYNNAGYVSFNLNNATLNDFNNNNDQFAFIFTMDRLGWFFIYTQHLCFYIYLFILFDIHNIQFETYLDKLKNNINDIESFKRSHSSLHKIIIKSRNLFQLVFSVNIISIIIRIVIFMISYYYTLRKDFILYIILSYIQLNYTLMKIGRFNNYNERILPIVYKYTDMNTDQIQYIKDFLNYNPIDFTIYDVKLNLNSIVKSIIVYMNIILSIYITIISAKLT